MSTLYVGSTEAFCGKSAIAVGIGMMAQDRGLTVGYMKPVTISAEGHGDSGVDEDAEFAARVFDLRDSLSSMAPVSLSRSDLELVLEGQAQVEYQQMLVDAHAHLADGRDLLLLEGGRDLREGYTIGLPTAVVTRLLNARALMVVPYGNSVLTDDAIGVQATLGDRLMGVIINRVPRYRMRFVEETVRPYLQKRGIRVYGVLPEERLLQAVSVREIAARLDGEVLSAPHALDELVENLMVGAMGVDSALSYFRRLPNKAVITGGDRPDVQLAAMETSTRCIVLTGNLRPNPIILSRAEEIGVPMILVKPDTLTTVEAISGFFGRTRFHQAKKVERFRELMSERFDADAFFADLQS